MVPRARSVSSPTTEVAIGETPTSSPPNEVAVLVTVTLATMLAPLNSTMIAVALPRIMGDFHVGIATAGWLITSYLIVMAALQPVAGKLGDRLGRRRLLLGGLLAFGLASFGAAIAPTLPFLFICRLGQAVAGAIALPNGTALVREVVPPQRRAARYGLVGAAVSFAAAAGPPLGGFIVGAAGWRAIFDLNVVLIVPALLLGWRVIPRTRMQGTLRRFDVGGALLLSCLLLGAAILLTQGDHEMGLVGLGLGAMLMLGVAVVFLRRELRHPDPVLQPRLFRHRTFASANAAIALSNLAMYSTLLSIPLLLAGRQGWGSTAIGLVLASMSGTVVLFAPLGGRLADRWGRRWPTVLGLALFTCGLLPLAFAGADVGVPLLVGSLAVAGIGLGLSTAGMQTAAIESVPPHEAGVASGLFSTSRYLGSIVGSSLLAGLLEPAHASRGFATVFVMVVAAAFLSTVASLGLGDRPSAG
jgi:EmrB/QacA subfamily drug resistance transporter